MISTRILLFFGLAVSLNVMAAVSFGQQVGKCAYCAHIPCETGQLQGECVASGVSTKCSYNGQSGCDRDCVATLFCNSGAVEGASSTGCIPGNASAKLVRSLAPQAVEGKAAEEAKMRDEMARAGALSAVRMETQFKDPVTLTSVTTNGHDMLSGAQVLNLSDKVVLAIRIGWVVRTPNEPDDVETNGWITLPSNLEPDGLASIAAQKIDTAQLWKAGTIVWFYVAQVRFQDGSVWERKQDKKPEQNNTSSVVPARPLEIASVR